MKDDGVEARRESAAGNGSGTAAAQFDLDSEAWLWADDAAGDAPPPSWRPCLRGNSSG